jgi:hypothetical protein
MTAKRSEPFPIGAIPDNRITAIQGSRAGPPRNNNRAAFRLGIGYTTVRARYAREVERPTALYLPPVSEVSGYILSALPLATWLVCRLERSAALPLATWLVCRLERSATFRLAGHRRRWWRKIIEGAAALPLATWLVCPLKGNPAFPLSWHGQRWTVGFVVRHPAFRLSRGRNARARRSNGVLVVKLSGPLLISAASARAGKCRTRGRAIPPRTGRPENLTRPRPD